MTVTAGSSWRGGLAAWFIVGAAALWGQAAPYFDGKAAFGLLERQVAMGPRLPGSKGHAALVQFLEDYLSPRADAVKVQKVTRTHPYRGDSLQITNILARFNPSARRHVLALAHYDTREVADQDEVPANRSQPIMGANDGASGVAVLLTLAEILAREAPPVGVDLLFVDAEDVGRSGDVDNFSLGTKAFIPAMATLLEGARPDYVVLLDMVGDAELELPMEYYSFRDARALVLRIWSLARDLGFAQFRSEVGAAVYDDHMPFLEIGIPAVNIIDIEYPNAETNYWHTLEDTPDKCSPESLEAVGTVLTTLIYSERL